MVPINYFAVLVGAISNMIIGGIWFGPLFGKYWISESRMTPQEMEAAKAKGMGKSYTIAFVGALFMSYIMAHALVFAESYLGTSGISAGLMTGFWNWLGFVVPVTFASVLWENKSWKFWFVSAGYYLITMLVMGVILAVWM